MNMNLQKKISTKISNSLTTLVVFTWNNFWGNNEGDPGHDDKEAGGKVDLQQDWSSPPHHLHLNNVGFDQFCHQCDISEGQISISPLSSKIIKDLPPMGIIALTDLLTY